MPISMLSRTSLTQRWVSLTHREDYDQTDLFPKQRCQQSLLWLLSTVIR